MMHPTTFLATIQGIWDDEPPPDPRDALVERLPVAAVLALAAEIAADLPLAAGDPAYIELAGVLSAYLEGQATAAELRAAIAPARTAAEHARAVSSPEHGSLNLYHFSQLRIVLWLGKALEACAETSLAAGRPAHAQAWLREALHAASSIAEHLARVAAIEHQLARLATLASEATP